MSFLFLTLAVICLFYAARSRESFLRPFPVYFFTQTFTLGIAYLQLHKAMSDFHVFTWLALLTGIVCFGCGTFSFSLSMNKENFKETPLQPLPPKHLKILKLGAICSAVLFISGIIPMAYYVGGLTIFSPNITFFMSQGFQIPYLPLLYSSSPLAVLFWGMLSFSKINYSRTSRIFCRIVVLLIIAIALVMLPNRTTILTNFGFLFIFYNFLHKKFSPPVFASTAVVMLAIFIAIGISRKQYSENVPTAIMDELLLLPYKYIANNYWNLDYALNPHNDKEIHPFTYGLDAVKGPSDLLMLHGTLQNAFGWDNVFNHRIQKVVGFNTVHWLWQIYKDFHLPGIVVIPFLWGVLMQWMYYKMRSTWNPFWIAMYSLHLYHTAWLFFIEPFKNSLYWLWLLFIWLFLRPSLFSTTEEVKLPSINDSAESVNRATG